MSAALLALSYDELKSRRDALAEIIHEADPLRDVTFTHLVCDPGVSVLAELDEALIILKRAREIAHG